MIFMYVIIVYDVSQKRVNKICNFLREYMNWVQNSVFEGELTIKELETVKNKIKEIIDEETDSVNFYIFLSENQVKKAHLGFLKKNISNIL
jgi:CRISPR-associated protein Cas2